MYYLCVPVYVSGLLEPFACFRVTGAMDETQIRLAAFKWLETQVQLYGDTLPRSILAKGFEYQGVRVTLMGPQGIWKPRVFKDIPISITTVAGGPYSDLITNDGVFLYRYRGTDPFHRDNIGLREAMKRKIPLIYFLGIAENQYLPIWPVYIVADNPNTLTFTAVVDDIDSVFSQDDEDLISEETRIIKRRYITSAVKARIHQNAFRKVVINAYHNKCAFCRLKHPELLDAAHIIPDSDIGGVPVINNGISLCKIHHAAYDMNIIGISPDYQIKVREDILHETDGPMLEYGIQALHNRRILLPDNSEDWPDRVRLAQRYEMFKNAG